MHSVHEDQLSTDLEALSSEIRVLASESLKALDQAYPRWELRGTKSDFERDLTQLILSAVDEEN